MLKETLKGVPALALFAAVALAAQPAQADPQTHLAAATLSPDGSAARIEASELLRVYSQEITASACFLHHDVEPDYAVDLLKEAHNGFDLHLAALIHGNDDLDIPHPEEREKTIRKLQKMQEEWRIVRSAIEQLIQEPGDKAAFAVIEQHDLVLYEMSDVLVTEIETEYSNPAEIVYADAFTMEVVGRMASTSQQVAKNACKAWDGAADADLTALLAQEISIYESSLDALLGGMPSLGIKPAPTDEIRELLGTVKADWKTMRPHLETILAGQTLSKDEEARFFYHMENELHEIETLIQMYAEFSKHSF